MGVRWKMSAKWLTKRLDCTVKGITRQGGCGGRCCKTKRYWPGMTGDGGVCPFLGFHGCAIPVGQRPVICLIYPLRLNKNGTLVAHDKAFMRGGVCRPCYNKGPYLIDALYAELAVLFGEEQTAAAYSEILCGRDFTVDVPKWVADSLELEHRLESECRPPAPRILLHSP